MGLGQTFSDAFPSSYLVERAFNANITLLDSKGNRLEIVNRGDSRLFLTTGWSLEKREI